MGVVISLALLGKSLLNKKLGLTRDYILHLLRNSESLCVNSLKALCCKLAFIIFFSVCLNTSVKSMKIAFESDEPYSHLLFFRMYYTPQAFPRTFLIDTFSPAIIKNTKFSWFSWRTR